MKNKRIESRLQRAILVAIVALWGGLSWAQNLPARIHLIVPFAATGPVDFSARVMMEKMREQTGVTIVVENRPSANGTVAAMAVKNAPATGEMLLYASSGLLAITPHLEKKLPFDVMADFEPVITTSYADGVLVVGPQVRAGNVKEFIQLAKASQKPLAIGSAGIGSILHGWLEVFKDETSLNLIHVPYKGAALAMTDVISGELTGMFVGLSLAAPHIRSEKLKGIGVLGHTRSALAPNLPTLEEQGIRGLDLLSWTGILAPKGTRREVIVAIADAVAKAMEQEDVRKKLQAAGITTWLIRGGEFSQAIRNDSERWKKLIADKQISVQ